MSIFTSNIELSSDNYPTIRPTLDLNFAATKTLDHRITFTRDSVGTFTDELGVLKYASNNVPRFDHDPSTGESLGLLIEESRTNQVQYSNIGYGLGDAPYYGNWNSSPYTDNFAVAPDGTTTAWKMTPTSPSASKVKRINVTAENTYTFSVWLKKDPSVSVSDGVWNYLKYLITWSQNGSTVTSATIEQLVSGSTTSAELTTEWRRFSVSYTAPANVTSMEFGLSNSNSGAGDPGYSVFVWGAQLEEGAFPTSYIPTNGTTVTRAADTTTIKGTNFTDFYNQTEGTIVSSHSILEGIPANHNLYTYQVAPDSGTSEAPFRLIDKNSSYGNTLVATSINSSSNVCFFKASGDPVTVANTKMKVAFAIKKDDFAVSFNGTATQTDTAGLVSGDNDHLSIGYYKPSPQAYLNGHIQQISYYPKRLPDAQLQGLTQQ